MAIKNDVAKDLMSFGKEGKFAPPSSQDPIVPLLHELMIANIGSTMFNKRKKIATDALAVKFSNSVADAVDDFKESFGIDNLANVVESDGYNCMLTLKSGASRLDKTMLSNILMVRHGWTKDKVDELLAEASNTSEPSKTWEVVEV